MKTQLFNLISKMNSEQIVEFNSNLHVLDYVPSLNACRIYTELTNRIEEMTEKEAIEFNSNLHIGYRIQ